MTCLQSNRITGLVQQSWLIIAMAAASLGGCSPAQGQPTNVTTAEPPERQVSLEEQQAYERARPVFEQYCARCHTSASGSSAALSHFSMDGYPFGGHDADEITASIREVLGATGGRATMPKGRPGVVQGEDLRRIVDWADAVDRAKSPTSPSAKGP